MFRSEAEWKKWPLYLIRVECKVLYGRQDKPDNAALYLIRVECKDL